MADPTDRPAIRVDHVGIAVHAVDDAEPFLELLGCELLTRRTFPDQPVEWSYYELGDASRLELVAPTDPDDENFVTDFLEKRGPGLHHVTLEVDDLDATVGRLEEGGVRVVDRADHGAYREAFVSPRNPTGALFQLMEYGPDYEEHYGPEMYVGGRPVGRERDGLDG